MISRSVLTKRFVVIASFKDGQNQRELGRFHTLQQAKDYLATLKGTPGMEFALIRDLSIPGKNAPYSKAVRAVLWLL